MSYRDGSDPKTMWIRFRWDDVSRTLTVERDERMARWTGDERVFNVQSADRDPSPPHPIAFRGERITVGL